MVIAAVVEQSTKYSTRLYRGDRQDLKSWSSTSAPGLYGETFLRYR